MRDSTGSPGRGRRRAPAYIATAVVGCLVIGLAAAWLALGGRGAQRVPPVAVAHGSRPAISRPAGDDASGASGSVLGSIGADEVAKKRGIAKLTQPRGNRSNHVRVRPPPPNVPNLIPAKLLGPAVPVPVSPILVRVKNGWLTSDGKTLTAVYAGVSGDKPRDGAFAIVRQNFVRWAQSVTTVEVPRTGAVRLVNLPLGKAVETTSQRGELAFVTVRGRHGRLNLATDKVRLDARR